jgi:glycosyltransferase involved in cell wall biosynthesis
MHVLGTAELQGTGISAMVKTLAENLDPAEFELSASFLGASGPWTQALQVSGVPAARVPWTRPTDLAGAGRFWRHLRSRRVDVLHLHYGGRSVRWLARAATGARVLVHVHGRVRNEADCRPINLRLTDADAVIATSQAVAARVRAKRTEVIYPGVRAPPAAGHKEPWTIGAAGRLTPIKGYDRLIAAFAGLRGSHPLVRLEIAGDGPSRDDLQRQVAQLGLGGAVTFLGWVNDIATAMTRWTIFLQPSLEEALGITVLQAMAAGLPVVASDVGGIPEIVEDGVTGRLVAPGDASALATAMAEMLSQPEQRARLGAAAAVRARYFSEERFATNVAQLYREIVPAR